MISSSSFSYALKEIHAKIIHIFNYYKVKSLVGYPPFSLFLPLFFLL